MPFSVTIVTIPQTSWFIKASDYYSSEGLNVQIEGIMVSDLPAVIQYQTPQKQESEHVRES